MLNSRADLQFSPLLHVIPGAAVLFEGMHVWRTNMLEIFYFAVDPSRNFRHLGYLDALLVSRIIIHISLATHSFPGDILFLHMQSSL
jgi:hypothetical protein